MRCDASPTTRTFDTERAGPSPTLAGWPTQASALPTPDLLADRRHDLVQVADDRVVRPHTLPTGRRLTSAPARRSLSEIMEQFVRDSGATTSFSIGPARSSPRSRGRRSDRAGEVSR